MHEVFPGSGGLFDIGSYHSPLQFAANQTIGDALFAETEIFGKRKDRFFPIGKPAEYAYRKSGISVFFQSERTVFIRAEISMVENFRIGIDRNSMGFLLIEGFETEPHAGLILESCLQKDTVARGQRQLDFLIMPSG